MIYLFHGSDSGKARAKAFEWVARARVKEPNLVYVRLSREELNPSVLEDAALSGGLFVKRLLVLIDDPFPAARDKDDENEGNGSGEENTGGSLIDDSVDMLAASDNAIVILAPKLIIARTKRLTEKAKVEYKFDKHVAPTGTRGFNTNLVNALEMRNREKLWLETVRALRAGDAPEMIHGLLHWKVRNLIEKGSKHWKLDESRRISLVLIGLIQESRRKGLELSVSLERFALSI